VEIPQICWHDETARIMSIDAYPNSNFIVTSSQNSEEDTGIRLWRVNGAEPIYQYDLQVAHTSTVNCVRFSPNGEYLASGADDNLVIIWSMKMTPVTFGEREEALRWGYPRQLRGHVGDVLHLSWSRDSAHLVSCSLDGTSIVWSI